LKKEKINLALIAHDGKKPEMVSFVLGNKAFLCKCTLFATGTTGKHIEEEGIKVTKLMSGPLGGDAQIGAMIAKGELDLVVFFRDPLDKHPHEPDVQMLMRLCDVHNVPLSTNPKSAKLIINGMNNINS